MIDIPGFIQQQYPFSLPPLPFAEDALAPYISAETMKFHYGKHHKAYVDNLNKLIEGPEASLKAVNLGDIIQQTKDSKPGVFNNAGQMFNHAFFWNCLQQGTQPGQQTQEAITKSFGSVDAFLKELATKGAKQFGSGWAWAVYDKTSSTIKVEGTSNAELPPQHDNFKALLTVVDVWEHAYYLDYQNKRPDYLSAFIQSLINWNYFEERLTAAKL